MVDQTKIATGAAAIIDVWLGGKTDWRHRLDDNEFLDSSAWRSALQLAAAVLLATQEEIYAPDPRKTFTITGTLNPKWRID